MKTKGKPWQFFVVAVLIVVFAFTAFLGISTQYGDTTKIWVKGAQDIRFGIDIRGGVPTTTTQRTSRWPRRSPSSSSAL